MRRFAIVLLLLCLSACAPKDMIRPKAEPCRIQPGQEDKEGRPLQCADRFTIEERGEGYQYTLHFVEFTEQGHFHSRDQLNTVLERIREGGKNQDILLFIHGWNHDARADDRNVLEFRRLLRTVDARNRTRTTTGVFVGWRGASIDAPLLNKITFWERKNVSIEVGRGSLIELIERLRAAGGANPGSRMISIGHSFGASVLLSATKNELYKEFLPAEDQRTLLVHTKPIDNFTILVNPAIEATPFMALHDLMEENERLRPGTYGQPVSPKIVVFTSESDWAVKYAFPAGRLLSTPFELHRKLQRMDRTGAHVEFDEYPMDILALGRFDRFQTHRLSLTQAGSGKRPGECAAKPQTWAEDVLHHQTGEKWVGDFKWSGTSLQHLGQSPAFAPAWVVNVDPAIIDGHGGIWEGAFNCFLEELVLVH